MSEQAKGLSKPDGPGKWWVERAVGNYSAYEFVEDETWGLVGKSTTTPFKEFVFSGDAWHRCYVPGLDTEIPDLSPEVRSAVCAALRRAGVWDDARGLHSDIDTLAAQRDEAKEAAENLRESNANLLANFEAQTQKNRTLHSDLSEARQEVERLKGDCERLQKALDATIKERNLAERACGVWETDCERLRAELASLRSQGKGEGEGDGEKLTRFNPPAWSNERIKFASDLTKFLLANPDKCYSVSRLVETILDIHQIEKRGEEASRAT